MTSFAFMFVLVPEPVWKTSMGKCASYLFAATSAAAASTAPDDIGLQQIELRVRAAGGLLHETQLR